ncbi:unnamed protein product, partial [Polarella glacialis]
DHFKTRICKYWEMGTCQKGDGCQFAHGGEEMGAPPGFGAPSYAKGGGGKGAFKGFQGGGSWEPPAPVHTQTYVGPKFKTQMCKFFEEGTCKKGGECNYAHDESELSDEGVAVVDGKGSGKAPSEGKGLQGTGFQGKGKSWGGGKGFQGTNGNGWGIIVPGLEAKGARPGVQALPAPKGWGVKGGKGGGPNLKTKMCQFFLSNNCTRGESCTFAHSEEDMAGGAPEEE